jgi:hypothetical protein
MARSPRSYAYSILRQGFPLTLTNPIVYYMVPLCTHAATRTKQAVYHCVIM